MKVGDLCRVVRQRTHTTCQKGDLVLITKVQLHTAVGGVYVEAINCKTHNFHHYKKVNLEVISESR